VRGKVTSFKLNDFNISAEDKTAATEEANAYFKLAATYTKNFS
jgi:aminoglycoside phosphotransferase family enzyme